ncbi:neurobeachin 2 [Pelomyxa schiedti]|nr:neurobeachin 2 [Pelomyxa schiedti]
MDLNKRHSVPKSNPDYLRWSWELEPFALTSEKSVLRTLAVPRIDIGDAKNISQLIMASAQHVRSALENPTPDIDFIQRNVISYFYLLNMLSRHPANVKTLSSNLALALQTLRLVAEKFLSLSPLPQATPSTPAPHPPSPTSSSHQLPSEQSNSTPQTILDLWWEPLSILCANCLQILVNFSQSQYFWKVPPPQKFVGVSADTSSLTKAAQQMVSSNIISVFVDMLLFLQETIAISPDRDHLHSLHILLLDTIGAVLHNNPQAIIKVPSSTLLECILKGVGWTYISLHRPDLCEEEFEVQMLSLQVLLEAIEHNSQNLQFAISHSCMHNILDFILWMAEAFSDPLTEALASVSHPPGQFIPQPVARNRSAQFCVLISELERICRPTGPLSSHFFPVLLNHLFNNDIRDTEANARARRHLRTVSPELQLSLCELFVQLILTSPDQIDVMNENGFWKLLVSEYFLFAPPFISDSSPLFDLFHAYVWDMITFLGNSFSKHNLRTCKFIVAYLEAKPPKSGLKLCGESLQKMLTHNRNQTESSLLQIDALPSICSTLMTLQQAKHPAIGVWRSVLSFFLGETLICVVLKKSEVIETIFELSKYTESRDFALTHILRLLKLPITPVYSKIWTVLYQRYLQLFPENTVTNDSNVDILLRLLDGVQQICNVDEEHKKSFQEGTGFVNIMSLLNIGSSGKHTSLLSSVVLETLAVILHKNKKNMRKFSSIVGYDQLQHLLISAEGGNLSRHTLDLLLNLVVDDCFDFRSSCRIRNPDVMPTILNLFPYFDRSVQIELLDVTTVITQKCSFNRSICCACGIISILLLHVENSLFDQEILERLMTIIEILASHNFTVRELKQLIHLSRSDSSDFRTPVFPLLLHTISNMAKPKSGPEYFFDYDGSSSSLILPSFERWPFVHGFTFCIWVRVESFTDPVTNQPMELCLFSFLEENQGIEMLFRKGHPMLRTWRSAKPYEVSFKELDIQEKRWYFFVIVQEQHRLGQGELQIFIDGERKVNTQFSFPKHKTTENRVGSSSSQGKPTHSFYGQIGSLSIFHQALSQFQVSSIFSKGPNYIGSFTEADFEAPNVGEISDHLFLNFNCKAQKGKFCLDNSPERAGQQPLLAKMHSLTPCVARSIKDYISCTGGLKVLFPLILLLNQPPAPYPSMDECGPACIDYSTDSSLSNLIIGILKDMLDGCVVNQEEMLRSKACRILAHLLKRIAPSYMSKEVLISITDLIASSHNNTELETELFERLLLDFQIWIYASFEVQKAVLAFIVKFRGSQKVGVPQLLTIARQYYWYENYFSYWKLQEIIGQRPSILQLKILRAIIFESIESIMRAETSMACTQAIYGYLVSCLDKMQIIEILAFTRKMLLAMLPAFLDQVVALGGCDIYLMLLKNSTEEIRNEAIHQLSMVHVWCINQKRPLKNLDLTMTMPCALLYSHNSFSNATYTALFCLMIGAHSKPDVHIGEDTSLYVPHIVSACLYIVRHSNAVLKQRVLQDLCLLCTKVENRECLLNFNPWQFDLVQLLSLEASNQMKAPPLDLDSTNNEDFQIEDIHAVNGLVGSLLRYIAIHGFHQRGGWLWLDNILAVIRNFAKEYKFGYPDLAFSIFYQITTTIKPELKAVHQNQSKASPLYLNLYKKSCPLMANLLNFFMMVEDHVFFLNSVLQPPTTQSKLSSSSYHSLPSVTDSVSPSPLSQSCLPLSSSPTPTSPVLGFNTLSISVPPSPSTPPPPSTAPPSPSIQVGTPPIPRTGSHITLRKSHFTLSPLTLFQLQFKCDPRQELDLLTDIIEILDCFKLLTVTSFAGMEQFNVKSSERTLLRRPGGALRLIVQLSFRVLAIASLLPDSQTSVSSCVSRLQASISQELASHDPPSPRLYYILSQCIETLRIPEAQPPANSLLILLQKLLRKVQPDVVSSFSSHKTNCDFDLLLQQVGEFISNGTTNGLVSNHWSALFQFSSERGDSYVNEQVSILPIVQQHYAKSDELSNKFIEQVKNDRRDLIRRGDELLDSLSNRIVFPELQRIKQISSEASAANIEAAYTWKHLLRELKDGRGPWAFIEGPTGKTFWKLDKTENYSRMRLKKKQNYNFDKHIGAAAAAHGQEMPQRPELPKLAPPVGGKGGSGEQNVDLELDADDIREEKTEVATVKDDDVTKVIYKTPCELITPLKVTPGSLTVTQRALHFLEERKEIPGEENKKQAPPKEKHWDVETIREVHLRRFLLRPSALEIFFVDQTNVFLNFPQRKNRAMYSKIVDILKPPNLAYSDSRSPADILRSSGLTKQWQMYQLSNFDYLMQLNTIAGRSYNDITQYPVFPWVISDYTSDSLDLNNPKTYRDLSKPIGALNPNRLEAFQERCKTFAESDPDIPPFLYGSHYSSAGIVLFYLIRMEPFTSHFLKLQGGKFDHADRMFDSIPNTWRNCLHGTTDLKELIPEFFYLPDFLLNLNEFDFGVRQNGKPLNDVVLPPWAETTEQFVHLNRQALESEYVSQHLHEWIDLIFGYKQRGEEAVRANNVFYYLTYEGAVNLDKIKDDVTRLSMQQQISEFGQTPSQLLGRPHPPRLQPDVMAMSVCHAPENLKAWHVKVSTQPVVFIGIPEANLLSPFLYLGATDHVVTVDESRNLGNHRWSTVADRNHLETGGPPFVFVGDPLMCSHKPIAIPFATDMTPSSSLFAVSVDGSYIVTCGHWDNSIKVSSVESRKLTQSIIKHKDIVTCIMIGQDGQTLLSGSKDTTLMVWNIDYQGNSFFIHETPRAILCGHDDEVTCLDINYELDITVSGSKDGTCILHTMRRGQFVWSVKLPGVTSVTMVKISPVHGNVVVYSAEQFTLYLLSVDGKLLTRTLLHEKLGDIIISRDGYFVITGGNRNTVVVRKLHNLKFAHKYSVSCPITSLAMAVEERHLLVGLTDGNLLIISRHGAKVGKSSKAEKPTNVLS